MKKIRRILQMIFTAREKFFPNDPELDIILNDVQDDFGTKLYQSFWRRIKT